jgi:hypothetical protein
LQKGHEARQGADQCRRRTLGFAVKARIVENLGRKKPSAVQSAGLGKGIGDGMPRLLAVKLRSYTINMEQYSMKMHKSLPLFQYWNNKGPSTANNCFLLFFSIFYRF